MTSKKHFRALSFGLIFALSSLTSGCYEKKIFIESPTEQDWFKKSTPEIVGLNAEDVNKFAALVKKLVSKNEIIGGEI